MALTDTIRDALRNCGKTMYQIHKETGVDQSALSRFLGGERGLQLGTLEKVLEAAGLEVILVKAKRQDR